MSLLEDDRRNFFFPGWHNLDGGLKWSVSIVQGGFEFFAFPGISFSPNLPALIRRFFICLQNVEK